MDQDQADLTSGVTLKTLYQTKQCWSDAINWVAPPNECNFTVTDPDVVVK